MKLLLTAFDPFGGEKVNPAQKAVSLVGEFGGIEIVKLTVPTVFREASRQVIEAIRREKPVAVLCIGQAGGRAAVTPERVAINLMDARIPDNAGNRPEDEPIFPSAPDAYFSTLPIKKMVEAIRKRGIPAEVSNTAGTFVCNELMYSVLHALKTEFPSAIGGFMHVPFIPEQAANKGANVPSMNLNDIVCAIEAAVGAIYEALFAKIIRDRAFSSVSELINLVMRGGEIELRCGKTRCNILPYYEHKGMVFIGIGHDYKIEDLCTASIEGASIQTLLIINGAVYHSKTYSECRIHSIEGLLKMFIYDDSGYAKICDTDGSYILIMHVETIPEMEDAKSGTQRARVFKWRECPISDIGSFLVDGKPLSEILCDSEVLFRSD